MFAIIIKSVQYRKQYNNKILVPARVVVGCESYVRGTENTKLMLTIDSDF